MKLEGKSKVNLLKIGELLSILSVLEELRCRRTIVNPMMYRRNIVDPMSFRRTKVNPLKVESYYQSYDL